MAITQDGWFNDTMVAALSNSIALNLASTTPGVYKGALFLSALTPNFSQSSPAYGSSPFNANESSGPGYTAGGTDLTVTGFAELSAANKIGWQFDPAEWTESTLSAEGLLIYAPGLTNRAVLLRWLGQSYTTADGSFTVNFATDGVWRQVLRNVA